MVSRDAFFMLATFMDRAVGLYLEVLTMYIADGVSSLWMDLFSSRNLSAFSAVIPLEHRIQCWQVLDRAFTFDGCVCETL